ncbi:conserved hypothetical protein [Leptospira interrogans serovar Manilae]|uniref:Uncharacterized protein n=1 Tax=Leptospira interrogans serovar Manilae TaxID=214675 RepID=A0AAQ1P3C4_LEPIR|nr:hypothetical protein [Leptospira interrogans]AKP27335.1 hypothetical protein LIMLP_16310 [Leptospira interrogans serovar Manilae]AKP31105.1 hypothetical protein LIMHP_16300 [Leptospira interrogans serovar Manilae]EYU64842.1 hypothetical protein CI00_04615 [Leptospira interrogans serovar Manilae]SOR63049.1 conserved hypothetical protein [Leptospira interrogans serovar Manilae]
MTISLSSGRKKEQNQPLLYFVSHESGDIKESFLHNAGSMLLKRMADHLHIDSSFYLKSKDNSSAGLKFLKEITFPCSEYFWLSVLRLLKN